MYKKWKTAGVQEIHRNRALNKDIVIWYTLEAMFDGGISLWDFSDPRKPRTSLIARDGYKTNIMVELDQKTSILQIIGLLFQSKEILEWTALVPFDYTENSSKFKCLIGEMPVKRRNNDCYS